MGEHTQADRDFDLESGRDLERRDATVASLVAENERLRHALQTDISDLSYYINNPSAWEVYNEEMSERLRRVVERARSALRGVAEGTKGFNPVKGDDDG